MKFFIHTFGCQMNKSDSERIEAFLENLKHQKALNINDAGLVILNTCSVRQKAEDKVFGMLKNLNKQKDKNPKLKIGITGCMVKNNFKRLQDKVDFTFDIKEIHALKTKLKKIERPNNQFNNLSIKNYKARHDSYLSITPKYQNQFHAYVPVMTGCDNFCSYCVVPYTRGREISRPSNEIMEEIKSLLKSGYKAITLIGQNVNSYGNDLESEIDFSNLLKNISGLPYGFWLWFVTSHPKDMSDSLINTVASSHKICPYIHLPVQAGSDKILKAMNRNYTRKHYMDLVKKIRNAINDVSLSTDIIVGFPGESKGDFKETVNLFKEVKFDMAYIAQYSVRPITSAAKLKDNVPRTEKINRDKNLSKLLNEQSYNFNKKYVGEILDVLIEKKDNNKFFTGKTNTFKTVKIKPPDKYSTSMIGQIKKVRIIHVSDFGLEGKII